MRWFLMAAVVSSGLLGLAAARVEAGDGLLYRTPYWWTPNERQLQKIYRRDFPYGEFGLGRDLHKHDHYHQTFYGPTKYRRSYFSGYGSSQGIDYAPYTYTPGCSPMSGMPAYPAMSAAPEAAKK